MAFDKERIRAVVFDYGNTLVEFNQEQTLQYDAALAEVLTRLFGAPDFAALHAIRNRNRMAPYAGDPPAYRENDLREITTDLIRELYGVTPAETAVDEVLQVRFRAFVAMADAPACAVHVLETLQDRYALGLLSNYPDGEAVRESLKRAGLAGYFKAAVISGDVGFAKPHPLPFTTILDELDMAAGQVLFVGDNWLSDVQGAKRAGMYAAWLRQYAVAERFEPKPGDLAPDLTLAHLNELLAHV